MHRGDGRGASAGEGQDEGGRVEEMLASWWKHQLSGLRNEGGIEA